MNHLKNSKTALNMNRFGFMALLIGGFLFQPSIGFPQSVAMEPVGDDVEFSRILGINGLPGHKDHLVILQRDGVIYLLAPNEEGQFEKSIFVDLSDDFNVGSWRNASLAFHPEFLSNGRYFIWYPSKTLEKLIVVERTVNETLLKDSGENSKIILTNEDHYRHIGGTIQFGPNDGYLYIGFGDGDKDKQKLDHFWGTMLRIDIDKQENGKPYAIPPDNPFVNSDTALPEIWAWGLRQPHRFSFDPVSGLLYAGDVGGRTEEINSIEKGKNYGWGCRKISCIDPNEPLLDISRDHAKCVIGGDVYRGDPTSAFYGIYIFGDFTTRKMYAMDPANPELVELKSGMNMATFGTDIDGNIYTANWGGREKIQRLVLEQNNTTTINLRKPEVRTSPSFFPWQSLPVLKDQDIQIDGSKLK